MPAIGIVVKLVSGRLRRLTADKLRGLLHRLFRGQNVAFRSLDPQVGFFYFLKDIVLGGCLVEFGLL